MYLIFYLEQGSTCSLFLFIYLCLKFIHFELLNFRLGKKKYMATKYCSGWPRGISAEFVFSNFQKQPPRGVPWKSVLKICSKFTGEHPCRSAISIKLLCNFIEIALRHGCSPVNLLHIFRTPFPKNTSGRLLLNFVYLH